LRVAAGRFDEAGSVVERALATVSDERVEHEANRGWLFWVPPESVVDRVRLEAVALHREHLVGPPPDPFAWLTPRGKRPPQYAAARVRVDAGQDQRSDATTIDRDRLLSAIEQWWFDRALPEQGDLAGAETADHYDASRQPTARIHRLTPPLFVTLAKKRAAIGDYAGADQRLRERGREAEASGKDPETVRVATLTRLEIARASRSVPEDLPSAVRGLDIGLRERSAGRPAFALRALTGVDLTEGFRAPSSEPWTTSPATADRAPVDGSTGQHVRRISETMDQAGLSLDHTLRAMLCVYGLGEQPGAAGPAAVDTIARLLASTSKGADGDVRMPASAPATRASQPPVSTALLDTANAIAEYLAAHGTNPRPPVAGTGPAEGPGRLLHIVGARRLAALAQDEGELLALWLPSAGARLLDLASRLAAYAGDEVARLNAEITAGLARARHDEAASPTQSVAEAWTRLTNQPAPSLEQVEREWSERHLASPESGQHLSGWRIRHALLVTLGPDPSGVVRQFAESTSEWRRAFLRAVRQTPEVAFLVMRAEAPRASTAASASASGVAASAPAGSAESAPRASSRPSFLDQAAATGAPVISLALLLWLVGSGAIVFPLSSRVGGEPGWAVVTTVMLGFTAAMWLLYKWRPKLAEPAFGSAVLLVGFAAYYALIGALVDWMLPMPLGRWPRFFVVLGLLATLGFIPSAYQRVLSWWRSRVARQSALFIGVTANAAPNLRAAEAVTNVAIACDLTRVRTDGWRLPARERHAWTNEIAPPTVVRDPYATAAAAIDRPSLRELVEIRADLAGAEWTIPLRVDRADQLPWEALFSHAITDEATPDDAMFFYRVGAGGGAGTWSNRLAQAIVSVVGWNPDAREAWTRAGRDVVSDADRRVGIIHAIGTPILSSAGPRFRLADSKGALQAGSVSEAVGEGPSSPNALLD
jgi:hypothetical protein